MKFYFAPMEGVTGYVYRNAYQTFFNQIDKYFSPFIATNQHDKLKTRDSMDILPENNKNLVLVPQLLSNNAKDFIQTAKKMKELGYNEINLNLGCPSKTVVSKYKGSGFLAKREELDRFLNEVFDNSVTNISIKTRIGRDNPEEFYHLMEIYNKYPLKELIIHPRIQSDYYNNKPNLTVFKDGLRLSKNPICYNGDIFTVEDYKCFKKEFPDVNTIMLGRGLLANPGLIHEINFNEKVEKEKLRQFHHTLLHSYINILSGDKNVLFKMKELWSYMAMLFTNYEKYGKKIRKSERLIDYEIVIDSLFREQDIVK